jgi:long-chain acyl-CoA synthetase
MNIGGQILINDSLKRVMKNFQNFKPNALMLVPLFVETMHKKIWEEVRKKGLEKQLRLLMKLNSAMLTFRIDVRSKLFSQVTGAFGGNLKSIVCGGAPLSPELIKDFYAFGITVLEGYGITECAPLVAVNSPGKVKFHSVGQPVKNCRVMIEKQDESDETGEICVNGDNVMMGYYKDPEATAEVFTEDGWFRTGDIGYMDSDGYVYITGRLKSVIVLENGKNIFPEEIEEYLGDIEEIAEAVVVGRGKATEAVILTAVVFPDATKFPEGTTKERMHAIISERINELNSKLPIYKHIKAVELRDTEFEKTTSRKIRRHLVK